MEKIIESTSHLKINLLFNNVGFIKFSEFHELEIESIEKQINCNLLSHVNLTHYFYKKMIESKEKCGICFTCSCTSYLPTPLSLIYAATKSFILSFSKSLAIEAKNYSIDILTLNPDYTKTNIFNKV
jgi:short-subunit dehydrogenase